MFYFQWQDSYLTHIDELDAQHQKLVALINGLYTDLMNCPEDAEKQACVFKTLDELVAYSEYHFAAEEKLMQQYDYPEYARHKQEHENFKHKVAQLMQDQTEAAKARPFPVVVFLRDWLTSHVIHTDQRYGPYLKEKMTADK